MEIKSQGHIRNSRELKLHFIVRLAIILCSHLEKLPLRGKTGKTYSWGMTTAASRFSITTLILTFADLKVAWSSLELRGRTILRNDQAHGFQDSNLPASNKKKEEENANISSSSSRGHGRQFQIWSSDNEQWNI